MAHLDFVAWLLGWPIVWSLTQYIDFKRGEVYKQEDETAIGMTFLSIWAIISVLLW